MWKRAPVVERSLRVLHDLADRGVCFITSWGSSLAPSAGVNGVVTSVIVLISALVRES
jgi:hypothetical protein